MISKSCDLIAMVDHLANPSDGYVLPVPPVSPSPAPLKLCGNSH